MVNLSFTVGIFPDILQIAKITPIHNKECKLNFQNYKPISLLSVLSKIVEKQFTQEFILILLKIILFLINNLGFTVNYSTNHALISITEQIKDLVDTGKYVCGVFVDLEKAFDTVNHIILCDKLKYYGLRGNVNNLVLS